MKNVLFAGGGTGGHLYPALALADALERENGDVRSHFVGALRGVEARVLPNEKRPHTLLPFEPLRRSKVWQNWRLVPSMWSSVMGLRRLFNEFEPSLVVGTGGYASAPACLYAISKGVPVAIQEQNSHAGLTQRTVGRWARQIHLGFPEARTGMKPGKNTEVFALGNPIRPPDEAITKDAARTKFGLRQDSAVVLVTGGSQGSRALNTAMVQVLKLASSHPFEVLWATGPNNFDDVKKAIEGLPDVHVHPYISNMPEAMAAADVAISRAGAMATAELLAWGIPMILIPLPTAAADHQTHNARALENAGAAVMLLEKNLNVHALNATLQEIINDPAKRSTMRAAALERARPHAAQQIAQKLELLLG
ncbi:MAG TPA: undecaprenyldiphospho-muramoylpentapeptide beta-N-acetylglucosaminyltransferase [Longimicrobiales bacterium]|nr:undecaprenyldiphospho-muramoylpentapeptide beta-N-acetylglucosaminyltransferase [Longimicrobiales bacterium]